LLAGVAGPVVALPTYAFQRQRYWLEAARSLADVAAAGLSPSAHPLLGAATTLAEHDGVLFTTRLSLSDHPWLADHAVFGQVLVPGTLLLELALAAGQAVGCHTVGELTLAVPLGLPPQGAVRLQISVRAPDDAGARAFALYGRDEAAGDDAAWTCHATGSLVSPERPGDAERSAAALEHWPPAGAAPFDLTELYPKLASQGLVYGPAFQGLVEAWREGGTLYGRAVLPDRIAATAGEYGIHPALLDAALHLLAAGSIAALGSETAQGTTQVLLPFAWSDVALQATGASEVRVRMVLHEAPTDAVGSATLDLFDANHQRVARVGELRLRRATAEQVRKASLSAARDLYRIDWQAVTLGDGAVRSSQWAVLGDGCLAQALGVEAYATVSALRAALDAGAAVPERVLVDAMGEGAGDLRDVAEVPSAALAATARALGDLQGLMAEPRLAAAPVVWVTRSAVGTGPDDRVTDLAHAPLWGLLRSARSEHPDRPLRLVDLDTASLSGERIAALLCADDEADLALRHGVAVAARLVRADQDAMGLPEGLSAWRLAQTSPGSRRRARGGHELPGCAQCLGHGARAVAWPRARRRRHRGRRRRSLGLRRGSGDGARPGHLCDGGDGRCARADARSGSALVRRSLHDPLGVPHRALRPSAPGGASARRAGPGARRGGWRRHGGGAVCAPSRRGGVRDGEPSQVAGAARDGARRRAHRLVAGHELCGRVFAGDGWRRHGRRPQFARRPVRRCVAAPASSRGSVPRDGQDGHP
jgi:hypothetical protein